MSKQNPRSFDNICNEIFRLYKEKVKLDDSKNGPVETPTKPKPATPSKPERTPVDPFKTPRPKITPKPQNKNKNKHLQKEAYEDEVHPDTRKAFETPGESIAFGSSPMKSHPYISAHGSTALRRGFEHSADLVSKRPGEAASAFMSIRKIEDAHKSEINKIAVRLVSQVTGVPESMFLVIDKPEQNVTIKPGDNKEIDISNPDSDLIKHIHMRATMNMLAHGAGIHVMNTLHHMAKEEIDDIDSKLMKLYDILSAGAPHQYWAMNIASIVKHLTHAVVGSASVEYDDNDSPKIKAYGICFPVLVQELVKGVIQLLSHHHIGKIDDEKELATILSHADRQDFEPFFIMVGPSIYRKFNDSVKQISGATMAKAIHAFAVQTPDAAHKFLILIERNPNAAKQTLEGWIDSIYNQTEDESQENEEDFGYGDDSWKNESVKSDLKDMGMIYESNIKKYNKKNKK